MVSGQIDRKDLENILADKIIITKSFKSSKAGRVFEKLNKTSGGFKKMIQKFDGDFPVSHLRFIGSTSLNDNINAQTHPPKGYVITIEMNLNNLDRPELSIARTLVHETIHAEMFRKLLSLSNKSGEINLVTLEQMLKKGDFPGILDYYTRYNSNFDHQQMAAHYIETITDILQEFDNNAHSRELYQALAWEGLMETKVWEDKSQQEKDKIKELIYKFTTVDYKNGLED